MCGVAALGQADGRCKHWLLLVCPATSPALVRCYAPYLADNLNMSRHGRRHSLLSSNSTGAFLAVGMPCRPLQTRERLRILVAGGDGTITWVLTAIKELGLQPAPAVAIIPLGTGQ